MRKGEIRGVDVGDLVRGVNEAVHSYGLLDYFRTSEAQVQTFRSDYRYITRDLRLPGFSPSGVSDTMAPSEALFIAAEMVMQKVLVEENQISPEAWDHRRTNRERQFKRTGEWALGKPDDAKMSARLISEQRLPALDFSSEEASGNVVIHRFMDTLGLRR